MSLRHPVVSVDSKLLQHFTTRSHYNTFTLQHELYSDCLQYTAATHHNTLSVDSKLLQHFTTR